MLGGGEGGRALSSEQKKKNHYLGTETSIAITNPGKSTKREQKTSSFTYHASQNRCVARIIGGKRNLDEVARRAAT